MKSLHSACHTSRLYRAFEIFGLTICLAALIIVIPVRAQMSGENTPQSPFAALLSQEGDIASVLAGTSVPAGLAAMNLETLTKNQWKQLRKEQFEAVRSEDEDVWQAAAINIMYLTSFHGDKVDLNRASLPLMERYIFERDEKSRVIALAAMHTIGHSDTMARLSQRVQTEASPRVRRLTIAAVLEYFSRESTSKVEAPTADVPVIASDN